MKKQIDFEQLPNLFPAPVVLVSCSDGKKDNLITIAWCGIVSSHPPMLSISIRPSRYSHGMIKKSGEFVVNVPSEQLLQKTDAIGILSGRDIDKFGFFKLKKQRAEKVNAPIAEDCLIALECKVKQIVSLGSHDCFLAEIVHASADEKILSSLGEIDFSKLEPFVLMHKQYFEVGKKIGDYGFSKPKQKNSFYDKTAQQIKTRTRNYSL